MMDATQPVHLDLQSFLRRDTDDDTGGGSGKFGGADPPNFEPDRSCTECSFQPPPNLVCSGAMIRLPIYRVNPGEHQF